MSKHVIRQKLFFVRSRNAEKPQESPLCSQNALLTQNHRGTLRFNKFKIAAKIEKPFVATNGPFGLVSIFTSYKNYSIAELEPTNACFTGPVISRGIPRYLPGQ